MDRIFGHAVGSRGSARYEDPGSYEAMVAAKIDDAVDFERSYLMWERELNWRYYYGLVPEVVDEDDSGNPVSRSSVVSTDVRDTILTILPTLVRIFLADEHPVYYYPKYDDQAEGAQEATEYVRWKFEHDWDGYTKLYSVFKDALVNRSGVLYTYTENHHEIQEQTFQNISQEQYQVLLYERPDVEVVDMGETDQATGNIESITLRYEKSKPNTCVKAVRPEDFRISRYAKTAEDADLIGMEEMVPVSDFVKEGYSVEEIEEYIGNDHSPSDEALLREPALSDRWSQQDGVLRGEFYIRIDRDGDGIDELRYIKTIGENHHILEDYQVTHQNFSLFVADIRPHTALGDAASDLTKDIQKIKTNMIRGTLDNLAEVVNPKMAINELVTNVEDALNDEVGAVIRTRGAPSEAVFYSRPNFVGMEVNQMLDYFDNIRAARTGITEASKGLDPRAMQSTALAGIDAIISGAQERIELIAMTLAQTGFKHFFRTVLREITNNPNPEEQFEICGKMTYVNPSTWSPDMRVLVNKSLGKGTDQIRLQVFQMILEQQKEIVTRFGIARNPVVTPIEMYNTIEDMMNIVNVKNVGRYFKKMTPEQIEAMDAAPNEPSPEEVLAKAQMEDVKSKTAKAIADAKIKEQNLQFQNRKLAVDDDFRRDKLNVDAAVKAAEIANENVQRQRELEAANQADAEAAE